MKTIAHIHTGFTEKFGIPRQSGLTGAKGVITFEPPYNVNEAVRGLEEFSHIWIIWGFSKCFDGPDMSRVDAPAQADKTETQHAYALAQMSQAKTPPGAPAQADRRQEPQAEPQAKPPGASPAEPQAATTAAKWSPTVRPPRLGGNKRVGVFATRSPFRPNHIGLSCVRLEKVVLGGKDGPELHVIGADLLDGTPIYDIKPYISYADSVPDARGGFAQGKPPKAEVEFCCPIPPGVSAETARDIKEILAQDPRPAYKNDEERIYGMKYAGMEIKFRGGKEKITVCDISFSPSI